MSEARKEYAKITDKTFKAAKILLQAGSTHAEISEYLNISKASVYRISIATDLKNYREIASAAYYASKIKREKKDAANDAEPAEESSAAPAQVLSQNPATQVVEHRQTVTVVANHYMMEQLQKQTELLNLINNKLGAIIDDLYGTARKEAGDK